jgi:glycine hydroxymethyltransferase
MAKQFRSQNFDTALTEIFRARSLENENGFTLIASENHPHPEDVTAYWDADRATFAGGYFEGYPPAPGQRSGAGRYYQGVQQADELEELARRRVISVLAPGMEDVAGANVQAPSGAIANMIAYFGVMQLGDTMVAPSLTRGYGHLSHGADSPNVVGQFFNARGYGIDEATGLIDYDEMGRLVAAVKPKVLMSGFSSYPSEVDWKRIAQTANAFGAVSIADISHPGGLIGAGLMNNPFLQGIDIVTSTTHKTWGGTKGAVIVYNKESLAKKVPGGVAKTGPNQGRFTKIDFAAFPGMLGGPNMSSIASHASTFRRAQYSAFKEIQRQTIVNARELALSLCEKGWPLATGGTSNHIVLVTDVTKIDGIDASIIRDGWEAAIRLENDVGIVTNKNAVPGVEGTPIRPKGLRLGTPAVTTRGMGASEMWEIASILDGALRYTGEPKAIAVLEKRARDLARAFPVPEYR